MPFWTTDYKSDWFSLTQTAMTIPFIALIHQIPISPEIFPWNKNIISSTIFLETKINLFSFLYQKMKKSSIKSISGDKTITLRHLAEIPRDSEMPWCGESGHWPPAVDRMLFDIRTHNKSGHNLSWSVSKEVICTRNGPQSG